MYPPAVLQALRDALAACQWYRDDLRRFLLHAGVPEAIVTRQPWHDKQEYKVRIAGKVIDELVTMGADGLGHVRRLIRAVIEIPNFDYLKNLDDGPAKVQAARRRVDALRALALQHDADLKRETERGRKHQSPAAPAAPRVKHHEIEELAKRFAALAQLDNPQERGKKFEEFLRDLFVVHDLDPRGSFHIIGEQIDGAFEFEATHFIVEAKWEKTRQGAQPLYAFAVKVEKRLDNTLGLFIALEDFTDEALVALRTSGRPRVILMNGEDLALVLQGMIDFRDLLRRKIRWAAQTGEPFLPARKILS